MVGQHSWRFTVVIFMLVWAVLACSLGNPSDVTTDVILERPLVVILAPENGSVFAEGVDVAFYAIAQDAGAGVARLEFRVNDVPMGEVLAEQPGGQVSLEGQIAWRAEGKAGHLLTVEAFRTDGASLGLADVTLRVIDKPVARIQVEETPDEQPGSSLATAMPTLTPAPTMSVLPGIAARVIPLDLNVRQGPGTSYPVVGTLNQGDQVEIVGRNVDSTWWAITYRTGTAWVFSSLVQPEGDVGQVPLVAAP